MIYAQRTVKGRVVYKRKRHEMKPSDLSQMAMALVNRFPISNQPDEFYWGWQSLAYVAANATQSIGWRWTRGEVERMVIDLRGDRNASAIIAMRDFCRGGRAAINWAANWGARVPYVGAVLQVGNTILESVINEANMSLPIIAYNPKTGQEVIYW